MTGPGAMAAGFAVYVTAEVNRWGGGSFGLTVPKWDWETLLDLADAAGLRGAWAAVMAELTEGQRLLRQEQDERTLRLQREGGRVADVAAELGLTHKQVGHALTRARKAAGVTSRRPDDLQAERRRHAAEAVGLKRSGMARAQIAGAMGRSADTVDELLKDGHFYEAPEDHPERLELARRCVALRASGLPKEEVLGGLGVSRKQALRAFRDASFLEAGSG